MEAELESMWMTSPDKDRPPLTRLATGAKPRDGKAGPGVQANPEYTQLLQILDLHPDVKRQVVEALTKDR